MLLRGGEGKGGKEGEEVEGVHVGAVSGVIDEGEERRGEERGEG